MNEYVADQLKHNETIPFRKCFQWPSVKYDFYNLWHIGRQILGMREEAYPATEKSEQNSGWSNKYA